MPFACKPGFGQGPDFIPNSQMTVAPSVSESLLYCCVCMAATAQAITWLCACAPCICAMRATRAVWKGRCQRIWSHMLAATVEYIACTNTASSMCSTRYEMSLLPESVCSEGSARGPLFAFKRCLRPLTEEMATVKGTPLPEDLVQAMFTGLPWEAFAVCPAPHAVASSRHMHAMHCFRSKWLCSGIKTTMSACVFCSA
jgi:hypothetical protein